MIIALIFAVAILSGASGATLMKVGSGHMGTIHLNSLHALLEFFIKMLTSFTILGGMALYFFSAVTWLYLLTKLDVSFVQPILALTYVVTPILAIIFLHEDVPAMRWAGIAVIILGVFIVARTSGAS